jgi:hypothetical protein
MNCEFGAKRAFIRFLAAALLLAILETAGTGFAPTEPDTY